MQPSGIVRARLICKGRSTCPLALGASHLPQNLLLQSSAKWSRHGRCTTPLPRELRPNPASRPPYAAQLAVVKCLSRLAAPRSSSPPSLTRAPPADRLAPTTPHDHPLCSSPERSRATPLPSAALPTLGATIITRPATKRAPPPVGDSESGQILWSLIDHRSVHVVGTNGSIASSRTRSPVPPCARPTVGAAALGQLTGAAPPARTSIRRFATNRPLTPRYRRVDTLYCTGAVARVGQREGSAGWFFNNYWR